MYAVCYLRQCSTLSVVCINFGRLGRFWISQVCLRFRSCQTALCFSCCLLITFVTTMLLMSVGSDVNHKAGGPQTGFHSVTGGQFCRRIQSCLRQKQNSVCGMLTSTSWPSHSSLRRRRRVRICCQGDRHRIGWMTVTKVPYVNSNLAQPCRCV